MKKENELPSFAKKDYKQKIYGEEKEKTMFPKFFKFFGLAKKKRKVKG